MNVFLLPLAISRNIEQTLANFWWNSSQKADSRLNWMRWERLTKHKSAGGMGFRDFHDFNLAMLGKQGWRFISNPNSLVTRLYKARYFADKDFLNSELGNCPSFIWRSICEAKGLIVDGVRWKIGTGKRISIMDQPWLSNNTDPYISTVSQNLEGKTVDYLFKDDSKGWNADIIKAEFNERDQKCILETRVPSTSNDDMLFWSQEDTGNYSVRSAYKWLQQKKGAWKDEDSTSIWAKLWKIRAPPKTINVVWRAMSNCLPTLVQLQSKKVQVQMVCPVCHEDNETILHSLVTCPYARQCWLLIKLDFQNLVFADFGAWLEYIFQAVNGNEKAIVITLCWAIWRNRNDLIWNQRGSSVNKTVAAAKQYLAQWSLAQSRSSVVLLQPGHEGDGDVIWVNPQQNSVKVSVDAAVFEDKGATGFGLIARDSKGMILQAKAILNTEYVSPVLAEAMAVKEALSWIDRMKWKDVILVSDCLVVVQAIRSTTAMRSLFGNIVEECRDYLRRLNKIALYHVKRSANRAAHQLARESYNFPGRIFNRDSIPCSVKRCIELDLSS